MGALLLISAKCFCSEAQAVARIQAHWTLGDFTTAVREAQESVDLYPESRELKNTLVAALSRSGRVEEALSAWKLLGETATQDRALVESLAWGVLVAAEGCPQLPVRVYALIGAATTRDAKALPLILKYLKGSNALLRTLAARLCPLFGDAPLRLELERLLKQESVWFVRLEVIRSIGALHMTSMRPHLESIIANPKSPLDEKMVAIQALTRMCTQVEDGYLQQLVKNKRSGLRQLACEIIAHLDLVDRAPILIGLTADTSAEVRLSALNALGVLSIPMDSQHIAENDPAAEVAITAAWLGMRSLKPWAFPLLRAWIEGEHGDLRRLASAALAVSGSYGVPLSYELMQKTSDPYVRVNLALGLIGLRAHIDKACAALFSTLKESSLWMWDAHLNPLFRSLAPTRMRHIDGVPNYPGAIDQWTRLDILSVLSMLQYPHAQEAIREFLQSHAWSTSAMAATILIEEGDDKALEAVRDLLKDPNEKIRIQAALILGFLGADPDTIPILQEAYPQVDRETQVQILEALGHIGDMQALPFLLSIFDTPFQNLRVVAASAIIQCLYH